MQDSSTDWMTKLDDVYKTFDLWRSRRLDDAPGQFLRLLSAFVILRQADILEAEQEAIAEALSEVVQQQKWD